MKNKIILLLLLFVLSTLAACNFSNTVEPTKPVLPTAPVEPTKPLNPTKPVKPTEPLEKTPSEEKTPEHTHEFSSEWMFDDDNHWHQCSCGEKKDVANHFGGEATTTQKANCDSCGASYGELLPEEKTPTLDTDSILFESVQVIYEEDKTYSIYVTGLPEDCTVEYVGNDVSGYGKFEVVANIYYNEKLILTLKAYIDVVFEAELPEI